MSDHAERLHDCAHVLNDEMMPAHAGWVFAAVDYIGALEAKVARLESPGMDGMWRHIDDMQHRIDALEAANTFLLRRVALTECEWCGHHGTPDGLPPTDITPEDIGMERVNDGELLNWPWYRYPPNPPHQLSQVHNDRSHDSN